MKFSLPRLDRLLFRAGLKRFLITTLILATVTGAAIGGVKLAGVDFGGDSDAHEHNWVEATCQAAKTCSDCGAREGNPLKHELVDPTCDAPMTCSICNQTWGEPNGHRWTDSNCSNPKTCRTCGVTEGEALGHIWADPTCDTPKKCTVCKVEEGEALGHDLVIEIVEATCTEAPYAATPLKTILPRRSVTWMTLFLPQRILPVLRPVLLRA